jgi:hypothetical protein
VLTLLMVAGAMGVVSATTALWMQGRSLLHQRIFALLVSFAITVILFSLVAWAAAAIVTIAPLSLTWIFVGTLALLFALRLYRELRALPEMDSR